MKNVEITLLTEITSTLLGSNFDGFYFLDLLSSEVGIAADEYSPMDSDGEFLACLLVDLTVADIRQTVDRVECHLVLDVSLPPHIVVVGEVLSQRRGARPAYQRG